MFPYIKQLSERLKSEFKKLNIDVYFKNSNTICNLFSNKKDKLEKNRLTGVVHKINCLGCNKCYIGQTKNNLVTRINQHKNNINNSSGKTGLSEHTITFSHQFDFNNVIILEKNIHNDSKRLSLENFHIKNHNNTVNLQRESEKLSNIYCNIVFLFIYIFLINKMFTFHIHIYTIIEILII